MPTALIYALTVLIWGSTWIMIKYQLGVVPQEVSIVYRFALAALALVVLAIVQRRRLTVPLRFLPAVALQGVFMFCANYYFVYHGAAYIASGLIAVLFTSIVILNAVNERLFFGKRIQPSTLIAGALSLCGVALMFWPEVSALSLDDDAVKGFALVLTGAYMASLGNMAAVLSTRRKLPVIAVNAQGMALGALCSALFAVVTNKPFIVDWQPAYIGSLLFLALPGTAIAFGLYLQLIERIGPTKASYTTVMLPVVALLISTVFEGYEWSALAISGLAIALVGNVLALAAKASPAPKSPAP
ncbi:MAG: DMT family transporter [Pseudomonadota bacterium]